MKLKTLIKDILLGLEALSRTGGQVTTYQDGRFRSLTLGPGSEYGERFRNAVIWASGRGIVDELLIEREGCYVFLSRLPRCTCCGNGVTPAQMEPVIVDFEAHPRTTELWCRSCLDSRASAPDRGTARRCDHTSRYYRADNHTFIRVDGVAVCFEASRNELYEWESDGEFHFSEEPEFSGGQIPGYHDSIRPWRRLRSSELLYGCELEILAGSSSRRVEIYEKAVSLGLLGEEDGSLHETRGIEIIGPPMSLDDHAAEDRSWMKFLAWVRGKATGWDAGTGYGMHVNINRAALSPLVQAKVVVFIHGNRTLCERVAGREQSSFAQYHPLNYVASTRSDVTDKYLAISLRGMDRMEVRIFRSTIVPATFVRNIQFVDSVIRFCGQASARELVKAKYLEWMSKNRKRYMPLHDFLFDYKPRPIPKDVPLRGSRKLRPSTV